MSKLAKELNVIMLSHRDRSLIGEPGSGDAAKRHTVYGGQVAYLDIIMHSSREENLPVYKLSRNVTVYPTNSRRRLFFLKDAMTVAAGIASLHRPDLIVSQDPFVLGLAGLRLKKKFGAPLLIHFHGDFWDNPYFFIGHPRNRVLLPISKRVVKIADAVRVVNPFIAEKIKKIFPEKIVEVISTPVEAEKFQNSSEELSAQIRKEFGENLILYVGRLEAEKNVQLVLNAFHLITKKMPEVKLLILGNGSELGMLRRQVVEREWGEKIFFRGNVTHEELPAFYHTAKILVLPSNSESFGKVILEAASAKTPTVATSTTGAKTLIRDGQTGFLVPFGDAQELAKKIMILLRDESLRKSLGERAQRDVLENYSQEKNMREIIKLWERVANLS